MRTKPRKAFDLAEVERLASLGLTREQIAAALGASASTVYNRLRDDEEFSEAVKRGEALGIGAVASKLMDQINEGNTTAMIFYLKSRAGWRESSEIRVEANTPGFAWSAKSPAFPKRRSTNTPAMIRTFLSP